MELKHEEKHNISYNELETHKKFEKMAELKFKVAGLRQNHQDLGEFRKYLEDRGASDVFRLLFNLN